MEYQTLKHPKFLKEGIFQKNRSVFCLKRQSFLRWYSIRQSPPRVMTFPLWPSSKSVHPMLQQLLLGFAWEAEGTVLWTREAGAPHGRRQLLEIGFLDGAATGVHSCGGISTGEREKATVGRSLSRSEAAPRPYEVAQVWLSTPRAAGAAVTAPGSTSSPAFQVRCQ